MAAKRQPIGFIVRRPLTLWGQHREIGEYLPMSEVKSLTRLESMVRAGRFNPVYEDSSGQTIERSRGNMTVVSKTPPAPVVAEEEPAPKKRAYKKKVAVEEESNA